MASSKTARELAAQAETPTRPKAPALDAGRLLEVLATLLLSALGLMLLWQAWGALQRDSQTRHLEEVATEVSGVLRSEVAGALARLEKVAVDPATVALFEQGEAMDLAAARAQVKAQLGAILEVDLIVGGDVLETLGQDLASFGYAKSDLLLQAQNSKGVAPAQLILESNGSRSLTLASAVLQQSHILGYLLVRLEPERILTAVSGYRGVGRLELRQGIGDGVMIASSPENFYIGREAPSRPVARSNLRLVFDLAPSYALIDLGLWGALAAGLILLGAAVALFILRIRPRLLQAALPTLAQAAPASVPGAGAAAPAARTEAVAHEPEALPEPIALGAAAAPRAPPAQPSRDAALLAATKVDRSIFRAYDIRGVVDQTLTPAVAHLIGRAVGSEVRARNLKEVVVARDGRLSGPALLGGLVEGLRAAGCDVIDVGMVPTPVLYFATHELRAQSGVMVTGSHNPPEYNGFKIVVGGETLSGEAIQALYGRIAEQAFSHGSGSIQNMDVLDAYVDRISSDIQLETPLKVVADCGNGVAGVIAEKLLASIGCEVEPLYTEVDGQFPNHHPDPSEPHNLRDLQLTVKQIRADVGVAFDGDGDRLGVVTPKGKILYPDRLLMLFARDVLVRNPGATIIYDVKCTGHLSQVVRAAGGIPVMWRTGHSLIKAKMKEAQAELAGEMSGHFFFKERWFGFDDGLYAACRLLEIIAASGLDIDEVFDELPDSVSTPELKIPMAEGEHYRFIEKFKEKARFDGARISLIDGVRADWDDGWGLVRCSNTTPVLVLRFDGNTDQALLRIQNVFRAQLLALHPKLQLPF